jgi:hypothetical protein
MAATWLENISGANPKACVAKEDEANDPILQDLHAMKDVETKERGAITSLPPPRHDRRAPAHLQQQPKPKFVAHKDPKNKKGKESTTSNRLGGNHMA